MAAVGPSYSPTRLHVALAVLVVAGCARPAPELPQDYGSVDANAILLAEDFSRADLGLSCDGIDREMSALSAEMRTLDSKIRGKHGSNEAAGYIAGVLFPPAILATDSGEGEKQALDAHQARRDEFVALKRLKSCAD